MLHDPARGQGIKHPVGAIGAIIRVEQEIGHTYHAVKGNPFQQEWAFVLDAGDSRYPQIVLRPLFQTLITHDTLPVFCPGALSPATMPRHCGRLFLRKTIAGHAESVNLSQNFLDLAGNRVTLSCLDGSLTQLQGSQVQGRDRHAVAAIY
jgi:hypothetical protein